MKIAGVESPLIGETKTQQYAREALPILVRQATVNQTISYGELAKEIGMHHRSLNKVLDCIGDTLQLLSQEWNHEIPLINCLVCNKATGLPGVGISCFISEQEFSRLPRKQQQAIINEGMYKVYAYPGWNRVLERLNIRAKPIQNYLYIFKAIHERQNSHRESQFHLELKNYICSNPNVVDLPKSIRGQTEYKLPSGDIVDVLFHLKHECVAVEVKSRISDVSDIMRGLFQCIKYRAVIEAYQAVQGYPISCRALLALESEFPSQLISIKNMLGVEVIDNIKKS